MPLQVLVDKGTENYCFLYITSYIQVYNKSHPGSGYILKSHLLKWFDNKRSKLCFFLFEKEKENLYAAIFFPNMKDDLYMNITIMLANLPIKALILYTSLLSGDRYLEAGMQKIKRNVGQEPGNVQKKNLDQETVFHTRCKKNPENTRVFRLPQIKKKLLFW